MEREFIHQGGLTHSGPTESQEGGPIPSGPTESHERGPTQPLWRKEFTHQGGPTQPLWRREFTHRGGPTHSGPTESQEGGLILSSHTKSHEGGPTYNLYGEEDPSSGRSYSFRSYRITRRRSYLQQVLPNLYGEENSLIREVLPI
ncbi:hypothetical protein Fot_38869 [Forsythia ovata]|uniref:Uncharacterized protein n=1 Tax=Forsythia ovata TaxID=205694 RepID=A0ABD1S5P1_9LAMI